MSKGPNFHEAMSINWNKCKKEIEIGLDSSIERIISTNPQVTTEEFVEWERMILQEIYNKIISLKLRIKVHKTNPVLKQDAVIEYLNEVHEKYVFVPIDKAANNIAIICEKYYVTVILKEIKILDVGNETHEKINKNLEFIQDNLEYNTRLKLSGGSKDKSLPIMYWIPKLHKNPAGFRFIIASNNCSTKPLSQAISNVFKLIYSQIENFYRKSEFLSNYNKFWVLQNVDLVIENINIVNRKKKAKSVATYDFSTLYTTLSHDKLIKRLFNAVDFVFEGGNKTHICISKNNVAYWRKKSKENVAFSKSTLKPPLENLIQNCYFMVGNLLLRQKIGIPMGIEPASFWANLFLYTYENEYTSELISNDKVKARHFQATKRFIDDLGTLNDGGVFNDVYKDIYPHESQLKVNTVVPMLLS